ncbi:MAG: S41 family peptidase [Bacteroidales bacterium]|jgi:carboxyl-terminal processing protease|nr:S41 family peptidase [Bacteroidales bacterium]MCI1733770.1 S41 family peptidase [Bacteroidales bacterium]
MPEDINKENQEPTPQQEPQQDSQQELQQNSQQEPDQKPQQPVQQYHHKYFKELLHNPYFGIVIIIILSLFLSLNMLERCSRRRSMAEYAIGGHQWDKLLLVLDQIQQNYVDTLNPKDMVEKSIPLILESLDPHSVYLPPQDLAEADESLEGNFSGIGVEFNVPNDTAVVINVIPGGPSAKAGLLSGDRIIKVNGRNVAGVKFNQDSLIKLLKGPQDTKVKVDIRRGRIAGFIPFTITRGIVPLKSLDASMMLNKRLGYIKLSKFSKTTYQEFMTSVTSLKKAGMKSLLLDLRDNPGGYFDQALLIANEFLKKGEKIVYLQGRMRKREDFYADGRGTCQDLKLYIAINENSASSSEIVSGAIQDNDRGTIIGRRSFGKGLVQEPINFSDNSGIRLTVARYYTPTGRCIQKPYSPDYMYDILERYQHGEMQNVDSIKMDKKLKYTTPKGRVVYGGGGIIPDVFVPLDTQGVSEFLIKVNDKSLQMQYSALLADKYRDKLRQVKSLPQLEILLSKMDFGSGFLAFAKKNGVVPKPGEWAKSSGILETQMKGLVGRYSSMENDAFYPFIIKIDNVVAKVKSLDVAGK